MNALRHLIVLMLLSTPAWAQLKIGVATGYGTYAMKEMKSLQKELLSGFPDGARVTEDFPGFIYYEVSVLTVVKEKFTVGGFVNYGSTGGRISYKDYSGEVSGNQLVSFVSAGGWLGLQVFGGEKKFRMHIDVRPQASYSFLNLEFYSRLGDQDDSESYKFNSLNIAIEPGLRAEYHKRRLGANLFAGYNINVLKGRLTYSDVEAAYLQNENEDAIHIDLSGFRVQLGVFYRLGSI